MAHEPSLSRTEEGAADTKIDPFVALPMGSFLPLTLGDSGVLDATWGSPRPSLPAVESSLVDEEKPIFTELEAELLLASLEDTDHGENHANQREEPVAIAVVEKPKKPKIPSRKRQLQEMEYLRAQVVELEAALSRTKEEHGESGGGVEEGVVSDAVWERIAQRQLEEKRRAEIENIKLRSMLEGQLRIAHSLEKLLTKRSLAEAEPLLDASKRPRISELLPASDPGSSPPQLDHRLAEIDAIMEDSGLASVDAVELDDCQIKTDDQNQIYVERTMTKLLPFPLHQAGDAAWRRLTPGRLDLSNGYYGTTRRSENDYDVEFSVMTKVRRATARCDGRGAGRRQRTPGERDVIVWQIRAGLNGQALTDHSVGMMDYGYLLVAPVKSANGVPSCILKACVRIWPQLAQSELDRFGLFVDLTLSSFNQNTKTVLQMIENDLLEQSLLSPSVSNV